MRRIVFSRGPAGVGDNEITESERRHAAHVMLGTVRQVDYSDSRNPVVRVAIGDEEDENGHLLTGWLPMGGARASNDSEWHPLEVNERVIVLSESGEVQNGLVIPAGMYNSDYPAPGNKAGLWIKKFKDGATISYDRENGGFTVDAKTTATVKVEGASVEVKKDSITLTVGGVTLKVSGDGVDIDGGYVKHDGHAVDKTHLHKDTQPGDGLSGPPQ